VEASEPRAHEVEVIEPDAGDDGRSRRPHDEDDVFPEDGPDGLDEAFEGAEDPGGSAEPSVLEYSEGTREAPAPAGAVVKLDPLAQYMAEIQRYPRLDRDEEQRLARFFRETGDRDAAARLITANLALVVKISRLFRRAVSNALDLIQEGNLGLIQALERFDPEVGVLFSTYAAFWIKAYILKFLLDNVRMVRVGTTNDRRKLLYNLNREKRRLEAAGFSVGPRLLAQTFGVSEADVVDVERSLSGGDVSMDAPIGEEGSPTRGEMFASPVPSVEDEVARQELKDMVDAALGRFRMGLPERDAAILDTRLLADEPVTLQEIGTRFGITREAVRQAEKRLTDRLREYLSAELGEEAVLQFRPKA
jgi:RNA polymerase sigma-32 factor